MKLTTRDRRALLLLGAALLIVAVTEFAVRDREQLPPAATAAAGSVETAQKRLARVRQVAATLAAREQALKIASEDLAQREKGVIRAETLPQAQAQLMQVVRKLSASQTPPVEIRNVEVGQARLSSDDYGEILIPMSFECHIEQLVNLLADVSAQTELVAVDGLRVTAGNQKQKTINVRLTLSGIVPRKLVPEKKGAGSR